MLEYKIEFKPGLKAKRPMPIIVFADKQYELVSEFFLAEGRMFAREIIAALDEALSGEKAGSAFAGNAFSLEIARDTTLVIDDIAERECAVPTLELRQLAAKYAAASAGFAAAKA